MTYNLLQRVMWYKDNDYDQTYLHDAPDFRIRVQGR